MSNNIFSLIHGYESDFINLPVTIVDGLEFDQLNTVKKIHRYYAGVYESGNKDDLGYKYFYNIGKARVKNAVKNIDIDTKDINVKSDIPRDDYKAWLLRRSLRRWMKENKMAKKLNDIVTAVPKYGSVVVKKVDNDCIFDVVDLRNLKCDPTATCLADSSWIVEDHYYTPTELMKQVDRGWDEEKIQNAIENYSRHKKENYYDNGDEDNTQGDAQYIHVKEFTGDVTEAVWEDGGDFNKFMKVNYIIISSSNNQGMKDDGLVLYKKELKENEELYKECHYDRIEGRWMGVGIIEDLFDAQMMKNEEINQVMMGMRLANLILLQSGDEMLTKNILTDLTNGDIIKAKSGIARIDTQNHGIPNDNVISQEIEQLANNLSNSFEVTTGASLPSGTPFSLGMLINQNANKLFDFIRENVGIFMEDVLKDWILPKAEKDLTKEHILEITDQKERDWINERYQTNMLSAAIKSFILEKGKKPTMAEIDMAKQVLGERMNTGEVQYMTIPDKFYDFKKSIEFDITGENSNKGAEMQTLSSLLQITQGNPDAFNNPLIKRILALNGISDIDVMPQAQPQPPQGQDPMAAMMAQAAAPQGGAPQPIAQ